MLVFAYDYLDDPAKDEIGIEFMTQTPRCKFGARAEFHHWRPVYLGEELSMNLHDASFGSTRT